MLFFALEMENILCITVLQLVFIVNVNGFICTKDGLFPNPINIDAYYQCASCISY